MNTREKTRQALSWIWKHTGAGVALLLIVLAFVLGYRIGPSGPEPTAPPAAVAGDDGSPQLYTCSMHPSVRLAEPDAKCPICFMDLIPVNGGGAGTSGALALTANEIAASRVETAPVVRFFPHARARLYGKIRYDETTVSRITAYFPGRIERLYVNFVGAPVNAGEHLAEIYSPELLAAFEELRQAAAAAEQSPERSDLIRSTAQQTLAAARDRLRLFGIDEEQIRAVEDEGFEGDVFTIRAPIGGVVTHINVREGDYLETGQAIATVADLSHLWLDLQAYESQLPLIRWGQPVEFSVESQPGEVFEGRISFIEPLIDPQTRTAAVRVAVENPDGRLKPGMFASAVITPQVGLEGALPTEDLSGRWVCPMHPTVIADGPGACSVCGMDLVPAESMMGERESRPRPPLAIPETAVLFTGERSVVYVAERIDDGESYAARAVKLGPRAGDFYIVRGGLEEGQRVVVNGAFRIDSAMQINAKPSMMTPSAEPDAGTRDHEHVMLPEPFIHGLADAYEGYLAAQEALADDDLAGFNAAAAELGETVSAVPTAGLVAENLASWRSAAAGLRVREPLGELETARERFETMSDAVFALLDAFGPAGEHRLVVAHCPMAFNFRGASWLQRGDTIDNPYFGASMLRCGEITREISPIADHSAEVGDE